MPGIIVPSLQQHRPASPWPPRSAIPTCPNPGTARVTDRSMMLVKGRWGEPVTTPYVRLTGHRRPHRGTLRDINPSFRLS